jgi:hypothetical protein
VLHEHFKFKTSFRNFPFCKQTKSKDVTQPEQLSQPAETGESNGSKSTQEATNKEELLVEIPKGTTTSEVKECEAEEMIVGDAQSTSKNT